MIKQLRVIMIGVLILFAGCRSGNSKYSEMILKDYKTSLKYKNYYEKEKNPNPQYYKIKSLNRFWQEELFLVIEDDRENSEVNLLLASKYRGKDWVYMNKMELISAEIYKNLIFDFQLEKYQDPIWKDNATLFMGVEERIALKLDDDEIALIEKFVDTVDLEIRFYSDYDERTYERRIREKEKLLMKEVLELYKEIKNNYETKKEKESNVTEKESA